MSYNEQEFLQKLQKKADEAEKIVFGFLPVEEGYAGTLAESMSYSVTVGGKRLRPIMMYETFRMFHGTGEAIHAFMAALEMIHNYSLVHDDLPAMDNDMYRRGKLTTHAKYGEAMAILAGDGLLNYAYETACRAFDMDEDSAKIGRALQVLSRKAGFYGMVGGQTADVEAEKNHLKLDMDKLMFIHENKTAALIQSALMIGAILAGASGEQVDALEKVGYNIGIAFQIQDDILDVTGTMEELGKPIGSDEKNEKLTYVSALGLERSKADVARLSEEALDILKGMETRNEFLEDLVVWMIGRRK